MLRMREAGMSTRLDAVGNVVGSFPGGRPGTRRLILGSHLDTVRNAGKYDGALGVMLPIACLRSLHEQGRRLEYPVDVIAFGDEEGLRFQATLFGSRAVAGDLDRAMLQAVDEDGVHLHEAMRAFGLDPDAAGDASYSPDDVAAYVEVHIEQGPVLEAEDLPVGVVTSIAGAVRLRVEVMGRAGHAGTVPMNLRRDALAAASEAVIAIERICLDTPGTVGTVGMLRTVSGAVNVIPGVVEFTIDVRGENDDRRQVALDGIDEALAEIASRRGVLFDCVPTHETGARPCSPWLMRRLGEAIEAQGVRGAQAAERCGARRHGDGPPHRHRDALRALQGRDQPPSRRIHDRGGRGGRRAGPAPLSRTLRSRRARGGLEKISVPAGAPWCRRRFETSQVRPRRRRPNRRRSAPGSNASRGTWILPSKMSRAVRTRPAETTSMPPAARRTARETSSRPAGCSTATARGFDAVSIRATSEATVPGATAALATQTAPVAAWGLVGSISAPGSATRLRDRSAAARRGRPWERPSPRHRPCPSARRPCAASAPRARRAPCRHRARPGSRSRSFRASPHAPPSSAWRRR